MKRKVLIELSGEEDQTIPVTLSAMQNDIEDLYKEFADKYGMEWKEMAMIHMSQFKVLQLVIRHKSFKERAEELVVHKLRTPIKGLGFFEITNKKFRELKQYIKDKEDGQRRDMEEKTEE